MRVRTSKAGQCHLSPGPKLHLRIPFRFPELAPDGAGLLVQIGDHNLLFSRDLYWDWELLLEEICFRPCRSVHCSACLPWAPSRLDIPSCHNSVLS